MKSLSGHSSPVEAVCFGRLEDVVAAGSLSGSLKIWDLEASKSLLFCFIVYWVHFTVRRFICICLHVFVLFYTAYVILAYCEHGEMDLMGLKPSH